MALEMEPLQRAVTKPEVSLFLGVNPWSRAGIVCRGWSWKRLGPALSLPFMTISYSCSCCLGIIFLTLKISAVWSSLKSSWRGEKSAGVFTFPAQKHCSPSLEKSLGTFLLGGSNGSQWSSNRETDRPSLDLGATESLAALKFIPSLPFWVWRTFQSLLQTQQEMQRAQVLAHPKAAEIPFLLYVWGFGHTVLPVLNSEHFCSRSLSLCKGVHNNLWCLPKLQLFLGIERCCSGMGMLLMWAKESNSAHIWWNRVLVTCGSC